MKKEIIYNKLVRDNILEIISNNNQKVAIILQQMKNIKINY